MKEIGGYFGIEYSNARLGGLHDNALHLNMARSCLAYILMARKYKHIYVPYYICDVVTHTIALHNISWSYYTLDTKFELTTLPELADNEALLYVNYFGLKDNYITTLCEKISNIIIDNSQALFSQALPGIDTIYSLRKFVGVSSGGFLYTDAIINLDIPAGDSAAIVAHLYKRIDVNASSGYSIYRDNELALDNIGLQLMPISVQQFLKSYDFEKNKIIRERNFLLLHAHLHQYNELKWLRPELVNGPLCYPFLCHKVGLKQKLIKNNIFVATYWPGIDEQAEWEIDLQQNLLAIPIDHRYSTSDMQRIINIVITE